ncbi:MAG: ribosome recycling factor [Deltaproteobacteria bacterium]|nr:ribosome recycling factor [Deltaproteobacteria bacterium]MCB9488489.1 ribosome recycling factor [Deltaproteobacteria bacterium]
MINDVYEEMRESTDKSLEAFKRELAKTRTGRANPTILDGIRVDYYGTPTPINQMATVSVPENRLIVIAPWDQTQVDAIDKAIQKANLDVNPVNDGKVIRLAFPTLTEDRRKDIVKQIKKMAEEARVSIRMHRRDANDMVKALEKDGDVTEDQAHKAGDQIQKIHDEFIKKIDEIAEAKEKEVMEI